MRFGGLVLCNGDAATVYAFAPVADGVDRVDPDLCIEGRLAFIPAGVRDEPAGGHRPEFSIFEAGGGGMYPGFWIRSEVNSELNFSPNFEVLVLGCIDADFCKKIRVGKLSPRSTQCTPLHRSLISIFSSKIAKTFSRLN